MEIYTQVPDGLTTDALRRPRRRGPLMNCRCGQRCCTSMLYAACKRPVPRSEPAAELGALGGTRTLNLLTRKMEISWACGGGPWPSGRSGLRGRYVSGGLDRARSAWAGYGEAAEGDLEAEGSELGTGQRIMRLAAA